MSDVKEAQDRPVSVKAVAKEQRDRVLALAVEEHEAARVAVLAKTMRLRELRLAQLAPSVPAVEAKPKARKAPKHVP